MNRILAAYETLLATFGPQKWWPSDTTFETAVGAVLTQGTAWRNAELAVGNLACVGALSPEAIDAMEVERLERLIGPAGFYRRKARTIKRLVTAAGRTQESWERFLAQDAPALRSALLELPGIGPETADAIALYAGRRPVFVVDAYTRRFAVRHDLVRMGAGYDEVQRVFEASLPRDHQLMGEYHALIVKLGKEHCRPTPLCTSCPLAEGGGNGRRFGRPRSKRH